MDEIGKFGKIQTGIQLFDKSLHVVFSAASVFKYGIASSIEI